MIKGIIFDLDGTLVDSLVDLADSMNRVLVNKSYPTHSLSKYQYFIGNGIRNLVREALPEAAQDEVEITQCFEAMMEDYTQHCLDKTRPYPGIVELLEQVNHKEIKCAVLSNKVDDLTKKIVRELFPKQRFEEVIGTRFDIPRKPNPEGALLISDSLQIPTSELLFVGDTGVDMKVAQNAQIRSVGVTWGYRTREELVEHGAQHLISDPSELLQLLSGEYQMRVVEIKGNEREDAFQIRREVFVEEQRVPLQDEFDEYDEPGAPARHILVEYENKPAATGRVRWVGDTAKLERICVRASLRKYGLGSVVVQALEKIAQEEGFHKAKLHAQTQAQSFYNKLGYVQVSEEFMEDGIPHIVMERKL
ncbi:MAG: GNAT family N-acetyltransferase [Desulfitobacterium sp.]